MRRPKCASRSPQTTAEKLYGWSVIIDVFHGIAQDISNDVRNGVIEIAPALHALHTHHGGADDPRTGMDVCNRVLCEMQQDYFTWVSETSRRKKPAAPDFKHVRQLL